VRYVDPIFNRNAYDTTCRTREKEVAEKNPLNQIFGGAGSVSEREGACGVLPRISSFLRYQSIFSFIFAIRTGYSTMATTDESQVDHDISEQASSIKPNAEDYESKHVHEVYQQIASHFSETRYKVCLYFP
jgi:hypothetical protein